MTKRPEGGAGVHCTRDDGSVTWQKPPEKRALFFALHDLTLRFYGLIAGGWDIEDTTGKGRRGPLPAEAIEVEQVAGLFDTERDAGVMWTVDDFNGGLAAGARVSGNWRGRWCVMTDYARVAFVGAGARPGPGL